MRSAALKEMCLVAWPPGWLLVAPSTAVSASISPAFLFVNTTEGSGRRVPGLCEGAVGDDSSSGAAAGTDAPFIVPVPAACTAVAIIVRGIAGHDPRRCLVFFTLAACSFSRVSTISRESSLKSLPTTSPGVFPSASLKLASAPRLRSSSTTAA